MGSRQGIKDNKWNIYIRQLRLSEYSLKNADVSTTDLDAYSDLLYRIVCVVCYPCYLIYYKYTKRLDYCQVPI